MEPDEWFDHFSLLLGKNIQKSSYDEEMENNFHENVDRFSTELDHPFTKSEFLKIVKPLKNNKAASSDCILNEMLKTGAETLSSVILPLFNIVLSFNLYPSQWKKDILSPLHKSDEKTDPNNFRGIVVSSCLGKLFNSMLNHRLMEKCNSEKIIHRSQASGKKGARTDDHLLVLKH